MAENPLVVINLCCVAAVIAAFALTLFLLGRMERMVSMFVAHHWGWHGILVTAWIGVPIHELSHLITAWCFGHRIIGWRLFDPDPASGTLGYVRHAPSKNSLWQTMGTFFIGIAPPIFGSAAVLGLVVAMATWTELHEIILRVWNVGVLSANTENALTIMHTLAAGVGQFAIDVLKAIWHGRSWWTLLFLYLGICIAAHLSPSRSDVRGGIAGLSLSLALLLAMGALLGWFGVSVVGVLALLVFLPVWVIGVALFQIVLAGVVQATIVLRR